eukprot:gene815-2214_t
MPPEGTETYNLYEKDVKTLEEVKEYLRTWFIRQPGGYSREWDGAHYNGMGFRRGYSNCYCSHHDLVLLDIDHLGKSERDIFKVLEEAKFDGLLIVDDIHLNEHTQRFWDDIKQTKHYIYYSHMFALPSDFPLSSISAGHFKLSAAAYILIDRETIVPNSMLDLPATCEPHTRPSRLDHLGKSERDIFKVLEEAKF